MTASRSDRRDHGPAHCAACPARPAPRRHRFRPGGVESLEDRQLMAASPLAELGAGGHRVHDVRVHGATPGDVTLPGGTTSEQVFYNTSGISIQPVTAWQGIVASGTAGQYFITGTSLHRVREVGLLYEGPISGEGGTTYAVNYPGATNTSVYGVTDLGGDSIRLVGSYRRGGHIQGFVFQGTTASLTDKHDYRTVNDTHSIYTFMHSTMNDLAVGDSNAAGAKGKAPLGADRSFIYDVANHKIASRIVYPGSTSTTAYGIWYNGGTSCTIDGGYQAADGSVTYGYLVDYDPATGRFSNWTSYSDPNAAGGVNNFTHFEGISSPTPGVYTLSADSGSGAVHGSWVIVARQTNGSFGPGTWVPLVDTNDANTSLGDNSVAGNQVVGIVVTSSGTVAYQATVVSPSPTT